MSTEDLYQEVILQHYRSPRNYGELEAPDFSAEEYNPICGDQVSLAMKVDDAGLVEDIRFQARGCAISIAAASMLTEQVRGRSLDECRSMRSNIDGFFHGRLSADILDQYGEIGVLKGVLNFPVRVKCVLLPWIALTSMLDSASRTE